MLFLFLVILYIIKRLVSDSYKQLHMEIAVDDVDVDENQMVTPAKGCRQAIIKINLIRGP